MELTRTIKSKIVFDSLEDVFKMEETLQAYKGACNLISEYIFNNGFPLNTYKVQKALYRDVRKQFNLKSQMAVSTFRTVIARYKAVQTQLQKETVWDGYKKDNHGKEVPKYIRKNLDFLWNPIAFKRPQVDLVRNRDYSFKDERLSLNTIYGRVFVKPTFKGFESYFDGTWTLGTAKVLKAGKYWYVHIAVTKEIPEEELVFSNVVGIDRGLRQIMTTYDNKGKTRFYSGKQVAHKRRNYKRLRQELQTKGTKSAKRRLKAINSRENRWMNDVNHCLSKTLVETYGKNTLFMLEDLTGVTFETTNKRSKDARYEHHSWAFYDLEQKLSYKAQANKSLVVKSDPAFTSQRCPKCGYIAKENRNQKKHEFHCQACSFRTNDDRAASMNIQFLATLYNSGIEQPTLNAMD